MTKYIDVSGDTPKQEKKTVFTHYLSPSRGWEKTTFKPSDFKIVKYMDNCHTDRDMFFVKTEAGNI